MGRLLKGYVANISLSKFPGDVNCSVLSSLKVTSLSDYQVSLCWSWWCWTPRPCCEVSLFSRLCLCLIAAYSSAGDGLVIEPTLIQTSNPKHSYMTTEFFGPIITIYVYDDATTSWAEVLELVSALSIATYSAFHKDMPYPALSRKQSLIMFLSSLIQASTLR